MRKWTRKKEYPHCPSSKLNCVKDLLHKTVVFFSSSNGNDICKSAQCAWFSKECGEPMIVMHTGYFIDSECFLIDKNLTYLRIEEKHILLLFKEFIHIVEDGDTKFTLQFKDSSESFYMWMQICSMKNVDPFDFDTVRLPPNDPKSTLTIFVTIKFKTIQSSNWYNFATLEVLSFNHTNGSITLLMKNRESDEDEQLILFCIRPKVTCIRTGNQIYYEPCDSERRYILDFNEESLCKEVCKFVKPSFTSAARTNQSVVAYRKRKDFLKAEKVIYRRIASFQQTFRYIRKDIKSLLETKSLEDLTANPGPHIHQLFFSHIVWKTRLNWKFYMKRSATFRKNYLRRYVNLQFTLVQDKLHYRILHLLADEKVPAELICCYRETVNLGMNRGSAMETSTCTCLGFHCTL